MRAIERSFGGVEGEEVEKMWNLGRRGSVGHHSDQTHTLLIISPAVL